MSEGGSYEQGRMARFRAAVNGVGQRHVREAQDALGVGYDAEAAWSRGDEVSYVPPDGVRRNGTIERFADGQAIVRVAAGECAVVPVLHLELPSEEIAHAERIAKVRDLLKRDAHPVHVVSVTERNDGSYDARLQWGAAKSPSDDEIADMLSARFEVQAHILDGAAFPGGALIRFRAQQLSDPSKTPPNNRAPGLYTEEIPGDAATSHTPTASVEAGADDPDAGQTPTTRACYAQLQSLSMSYPSLAFEVLGEAAEEGRTELRFSVTEEARPGVELRVNKGLMLTAAKAHSVGAVGRVVSDSFGTRVFVASPHGDVSWASLRTGAYDDLQSPVPQRDFDKGEVDDKTPALTRNTSFKSWNDTEHIGGPGLNVAGDGAVEAAGPVEKKYWNRLYKNEPDYAKDLTKDVPETKAAARLGELRAVFAAEGRFASGEYARKFLAVMASAPSKSSGQRTTAQLSEFMHSFESGPAQSMTQALIDARNSDAGVEKTVDRLLIDYLSQYPEGVNRAGPDAYTQILADAVAFFQKRDPKRLEKLRLRVAPEETPVDVSKQPGMWQRLKERVSPTERQTNLLDALPEGPGTRQMYQPKQPPVWASAGGAAKEARAQGGKPTNADTHGAGETVEGRPMPPALGDVSFRIDPMSIHARGSYLFAEVTWDPKRVPGVSSTLMQHWLVDFLVGVSTSVRVVDLGYVAGVRVAVLDMEGGRAVLRFRSTQWRSFPQETVPSPT